MLVEYIAKKQFPILTSEKHSFLYIKNAKTAGTSIKQVLSEISDCSMPSYKNNSYKNWIKRVSDEQLNTYFKFTFVRNPWDRMVSIWNYFLNAFQDDIRIPKCSFRDFLETNSMLSNKSIISHSRPQCETVECDNKIFIDFVGKFENIDEDWKIVCRKIGINKTLPVTNQYPHDYYKKYYDDWCIQRVSEIYRRDIELFNYQF